VFDRLFGRSVSACAILLLSAAGMAHPANANPEQSVIHFRSGPVDTKSFSAPTLRSAISQLADPVEARHVVVQFPSPVKAESKEELGESGLALLSYLGNRAFFAKVAAGQSAVAQLSAAAGQAAVLPIQSAWKAHPAVTALEIPEYAVIDRKYPDDLVVAVYVLFHQDVDLEVEGSGVAKANDATTVARMPVINGLVVTLKQSQLPALIAEDAVMWVEWPLPPMSVINDSNRVISEANTLQAAPYDLDGTGVMVMVYDGGTARSTHVDFSGRLTVHDSSGPEDHATHVAGTIGGDGTASGGTYKGMAPNVSLVSYGFQYDGSEIFLYSNPGDINSDYNEAINTRGADISNNSIGTNTEPNGFPCSIQGDYGVTSALIDSIVGGSLGAPFRVIWANGNERQGSTCDIEGYGDYYSTAPPAGAKNHITVGALNSNDDTMTSFSSWGPVDDGRMKPDISAPGCQGNDDFGVTSPSSSGDSDYTSMCGTSMAAPTVAGLSSLILQDFRANFPTEPDPRNSTLKVLFAHNAVDLGNAGPDHQFGYGSVRAQQTVDFMRSGNFFEDQVSQGETFVVQVPVGVSDSELKVTLAWDDVPGTPNVDPALVNDLDIRVISPSGTTHYPWTLEPTAPSAAAVQTQANRVDNIEQVRVTGPEPGVWRVEVYGFAVPQGPQSFSLAASPLLVSCTSSGVISLEQSKYACDASVTMTVIDCDLNTDDSTVQTTTIGIDSSSEPAGESVLLTETGEATALFQGSISLNVTDSGSVLQVADGDTVTATYVDADDGEGGTNVTVTAAATVDCTSPIISNVQTSNLEAHGATVSFDTDEATNAAVRFGSSCASLTQSVSGSGSDTTHSVDLAGLTDNTAYYYAVDAEDEASNSSTDDNGGACYTFTTPDTPDLFTELFVTENDLANLSLTLTPDGSPDTYCGSSEAITDLPVDPSSGTQLFLGDDDSEAVTLSGATVELYGTSYSTFYVGSNGYITFTSGDTEYTESLTAHFDLPRISALFDDLSPDLAGVVSWQQLSDRAVVTWQNVPQYLSPDSNTFQVEMHFDGTIVLSYLGIAVPDGVAGLSEGSGEPAGFSESDLSAAGGCISPGKLKFKSATYSVAEDGVNARIYVSRMVGSLGAASVDYDTANGTATAGSDYIATSGTLNWLDGDSTDKYFDVSISDDSDPEGSEDFTAALSGVSGASIGDPSTTTVTIEASDQPVPTLYFTELFGGDNDLANLSLTLTPDGSPETYCGFAESITALPVDSSSGTQLFLGDDDSGAVTLSGGATVELYGTGYSTFHVGSNGYITFIAGDTDYTESLADHFVQPRISALFVDLDPSFSSFGALVSWRQLSDRVVVTWENVSQYAEFDLNTFQVEMHFDGTIVLSYLGIQASGGLVGLSEGSGEPGNYTETDLSVMNGCVSTGTLQFQSATYEVEEDGASVRIYASRTGGSSGAASVNYATADDSATAGSDYTAASGTLDWSDGDSADKYFDVPISDDSNPEDTENFMAALSGASGASLGSPSTTTVTIPTNDQLTDTLQFKSATYSVTEDGGSLRVYVSRSSSSVGSAPGAASVDYATADGSATAGSDYTAVAGTLNWADGDLDDKYFDVVITDDVDPEGAEDFTAALSGVSGAAIDSPSTTTVTIESNDQPAGVLQFKAATYGTAENGASVRIYVSRTGGASGVASVNYATADGSATAGSDYTPVSAALNWADGDSVDKHFEVPIIDDVEPEFSEDFSAVLSGAIGASIGGTDTTTVTIAASDQAVPSTSSWGALLLLALLVGGGIWVLHGLRASRPA